MLFSLPLFLVDMFLTCVFAGPARQSGHKMVEVSVSGWSCLNVTTARFPGDTQGQSERKFSRTGRYAELLCQSRQSTNGVSSVALM